MFAGREGIWDKNAWTRILFPSRCWNEAPELIELYWTGWQLAWDHVLTTPGAPAARHMDEAFHPEIIWIWDTCFMAHFCKYAPESEPAIPSTAKFHDEIVRKDFCGWSALRSRVHPAYVCSEERDALHPGQTCHLFSNPLDKSKTPGLHL